MNIVDQRRINTLERRTSSGDKGSNGCLEGGLEDFAETTFVAVDGKTVVEEGTGDMLVT